MIDDLVDKSTVDEVTLCSTHNSQASAKAKKSSSTVFHAEISIGGMTCASCTGAVTTALEELPFVIQVSVNLLSNSGHVIFDGQDNVNGILERIDDLGYDASLESLRMATPQQEESDIMEIEKTVMVKVDGMFGEDGPLRVLAALKADYGQDLTIIRPLSLKDPVVTIKYKPNPPEFTIRNIKDCIEVNNQLCKVSIYEPPSIEEKSRAIQLRERRNLLFRLLLSFIVAVPTFLIGVVWMSLMPTNNSVHLFFESPVWLGHVTRRDWALMILATPVMFFAADFFHLRAFKEIKALWRPGSTTPILRRFYRFGSMNLLMSAGTSVAYFASVALVIVESLKDSNMPMQRGKTTHFDSVVFFTLFILAGRYLEAYSKAKTGDAVTLLGNLRPSEALLVSSTKIDSRPSTGTEYTDIYPGSETETVNINLIETGDVLRIPHGGSPPFDGKIIDGNSLFDESSLTGEARPVSKAPSEQVFAGTVNIGQSVTILVTGGSGSSLLDQIVRVIREGQAKRAPVERVADAITGHFVPIVILIALITFTTWISLGQSGVLPDRWLHNRSAGGWPFWSLQFAIAVFVVACPCGIGLAAPTALFVGSGIGAKHGILVKGGGEAFQEASGLDVVVFDKTGTLTEGEPTVAYHEIFSSAGTVQEDIIWACTLALEESSSHPIAKGIAVLAATNKRLQYLTADVKEHPGLGLRGSVIFSPSVDIETEYEAVIGSTILFDKLDILTEDEEIRGVIEKQRALGRSISLLALRSGSSPWKLVALFATQTLVRPSALSTVTALQKDGMAVYMLTGDNATTAASIAAELNIPASNVIADVLPTGKASAIQHLQATAPKRYNRQLRPGQRTIVAMVGDGINDAPALTAADVSVSLSGASGVAISSSKFILASNNVDLGAILTLERLSRAVMWRVKINFVWALVYNVCLIPIAAGVLMGVGEKGIVLGPVWASAAMAASSVSVVCSSLALRSRLPWIGFRG